MQIHEMRNYILDSYPNASKSWRNKVANIMPPNQIVAIFHSVLKREEKKARDKELDRQYHQMNIFEYLDARERANGANK